MKNDYKRLAMYLSELEEARSEMNHTASLRIGVVSGGPSIDEENAEFDRCHRQLIRETEAILANHGRLSTLRAVLGREVVTDRILADTKLEQEFKREHPDASAAARALRAIPSKARAAASRENGTRPVKKGSKPRGRPKTGKGERK